MAVGGGSMRRRRLLQQAGARRRLRGPTLFRNARGPPLPMAAAAGSLFGQNQCGPVPWSCLAGCRVVWSVLPNCQRGMSRPPALQKPAGSWVAHARPCRPPTKQPTSPPALQTPAGVSPH